MSWEPRLEPPDAPQPWWRRLGWMAAIWAASVLALGMVAKAIRMWIR